MITKTQYVKYLVSTPQNCTGTYLAEHLESLNQPLILIFEDLHWLDNEAPAFLSFIRESLASAKILLLTNYCPEYRHDWGSKTYYTQLRLIH